MLSRLFAAFFCVSVFIAGVQAEHRAALVIGNSAYPDAEIPSAAADADLVAKSFEAQGYRVTKVENLESEEFKATLDDFANSTPVNGTAIVYFSGYALAGARDDLVLLPLNARPQVANRLGAFQALGVRAILTLLESKGGSAVNLVLVDGCYRHPIQAEDYASGAFEIPDLPENGFAVYAADFGKTLEPVTEGTSPFSEAIAATKSLRDLLKYPHQTTISEDRLLDRLISVSVGAPAAAENAGDEWINPQGQVFCWIPPGKFTMGSPDTSTMRDPDETQVEVEIPRGFWMSKFEYTRGNHQTWMMRAGQYLSTGDHKLWPLNKFREGDLKTLLETLNQSAPEGWIYALPTEAEWEYAARAGTKTEFSFGNNPARLAEHGNFADRTLREGLSFGEVAKNWDPAKPPNRGDRQTGMFSYAHKVWNDGIIETGAVGQFPPNPWGLHDMHGNLAELTSTPYHSERTPPEEFDVKLGWVCRGGSWLSTPKYCRSAFRGQFTFKSRENTTENFLGLRFILKRKS
ncbi:MAG: SUMF1/EgtB/PvdO family nonheme iron enzyme [Verrucomicrobiota bacterium]